MGYIEYRNSYFCTGKYDTGTEIEKKKTKAGKGNANCVCITHVPFVYYSYQLEE